VGREGDESTRVVKICPTMVRGPRVGILSLLLLVSSRIAHAASGDPPSPANASSLYPAESFHIPASVIVASALGVEPERVSTWTLRMRLTEEQVGMQEVVLQVAAIPCQLSNPLPDCFVRMPDCSRAPVFRERIGEDVALL
jgi:hypothetical protein